MKYFIHIFLSLIISLGIFTGCSMGEFDETSSQKQEYSAAEKTDIYALAKKYNIELTPIENKTNEPLLSIEELEEKFKLACKESESFTIKPDGVVKKSSKTKSLYSVKRVKTRSETEAGSKTFILVKIEDNIYRAYADITITWNHHRVTNVSFSNVDVNSVYDLKYEDTNLMSSGPIGNCYFSFDIKRLYSNGPVAKAMGYITNMGCSLDIFLNYSVPGYNFYVKSNING